MQSFQTQHCSLQGGLPRPPTSAFAAPSLHKTNQRFRDWTLSPFIAMNGQAKLQEAEVVALKALATNLSSWRSFTGKSTFSSQHQSRADIGQIGLEVQVYPNMTKIHQKAIAVAYNKPSPALPISPMRAFPLPWGWPSTQLQWPPQSAWSQVINCTKRRGREKTGRNKNKHSLKKLKVTPGSASGDSDTTLGLRLLGRSSCNLAWLHPSSIWEK